MGAGDPRRGPSHQGPHQQHGAGGLCAADLQGLQVVLDGYSAAKPGGRALLADPLPACAALRLLLLQEAGLQVRMRLLHAGPLLPQLRPCAVPALLLLQAGRVQPHHQVRLHGRRQDRLPEASGGHPAAVHAAAHQGGEEGGPQAAAHQGLDSQGQALKAGDRLLFQHLHAVVRQVRHLRSLRHRAAQLRPHLRPADLFAPSRGSPLPHRLRRGAGGPQAADGQGAGGAERGPRVRPLPG
mmetsp:Transcript_79840/g.191652  ORF Transcript_79840/g.191652 Transcript_79840/m.191652 type:complete len:240 (+) Transcript_79840:1939-2658(+)